MARVGSPSVDLEDLPVAVRLLRERVGRRWWLPVVASVGIVMHGVALASILNDLGPDVRPALLDSIIYEYIGWFLADGGRLYVDIWEVKPPLIYEVTAVFAMVTGDDMVTYHWLLVAVTVLAAIAGALLIAQLTFMLTDNPVSAVVAGVSPYTIPLFAWRGAVGFKPKYFVILLGLLTVFAALRGRPWLSGVFGAASVGFWQLAIVFPAVAAGLLYQRRSRSALPKLVIAGSLTSILVLLPVVAWSALPEMIVEAVLTPLIAGDSALPKGRVWLALRVVGIPTAVAVVGFYGVVRGLLVDPREYWWLAVLTAWLLLQVSVLDFDAAPDLLPLLAVLSIGVGLVVNRAPHPAHPVAALIGVMVVLSAVSIWQGGISSGYSWFPPAHPTPVDTQTMPTVPYTGSETNVLFWRPLPAESCRAFYGGLQARYLSRVGQPFYSDCGAWQPAWEWIRAHWLT